MVGYPGAGKTTVARWIAEQTGAVHLWADVERHKMFDKPGHTEAESRQLYDRLNQRATALLEDGKSVVFDTNFNYAHDRQLLRDIANRHNAQTVIVWVATPTDVARERAVHSKLVRNGYDFTMTSEQFDAIADKLESPRPDEKNEKIIKIDGTNLDKESFLRLISA